MSGRKLNAQEQKLHQAALADADVDAGRFPLPSALVAVGPALVGVLCTIAPRSASRYFASAILNAAASAGCAHGYVGKI